MPEEKDELRTLLLELTPEQMQQYYDFGAECRKGLDEARIRYVKLMIEGKKKGFRVESRGIYASLHTFKI